MRTIRRRYLATLWPALALTAVTLASCSRPVETVDLPDAPAVLAQVGKRLSQLKSAAELTAIATREERVLALLSREERDALGRCHLRFRVDRPVSLFVATDVRHAPFWLAEQGFDQRAERLGIEGHEWAIYEKDASAGLVGLGVDRLDLSSLEHYRVWIRSKSGGEPQLSALSDDRWKLESKTAPALPGFLVGAIQLKPGPDVRNSTVLARGRVWKTHVVAGRRPDQIHATPGLDPTSELVLTWRTESGIAKSIAQIREPGKADSARIIDGDSQSLSTPSDLNDPAGQSHHARVAGLAPHHTYEYRVGDGTDQGSSDWTKIRTSPGRGEDLQLLYMGDPQCGLEEWGKLLAAARKRHPDASALMIAGDLVDRGNERTNWDHFFLRAEGVFEGLPLLPAVGNHEYLDRGPRLYQSFFAIPENGPKSQEPGLIYAVEYGDAFIAILDSTIATVDPRSASEQGRWLEQRLAETRCPWKIVMFHHPLYVSHLWRDNRSLREAWAPILERQGVNLVLQGHDHAYLRTYPLRDGQKSRSINDGTTYVVSVSGNKFCEQKPREFGEVGFTNVSTYQTINVKANDGRMIYRAFDITGNELDRAEWSKASNPRAVARR